MNYPTIALWFLYIDSLCLHPRVLGTAVLPQAWFEATTVRANRETNDQRSDNRQNDRSAYIHTTGSAVQAIVA